MGTSQPKPFAAPGAYGVSNQNMMTATAAQQRAPRQNFLSQEAVSSGQAYPQVSAPTTPPNLYGDGRLPYGMGGGTDPIFCPEIHTWLNDTLQAKDAKKGDLGDCYVDGKIVPLPLLYDPIFRDVPCVLLYSDNGCSKIVSETTPLTLRDGSSALAPEMEGKLWLTDQGHATEPAWVICHVLKVGTCKVALLDFGGNVFAGGVTSKLRGFTHNNRKGNEIFSAAQGASIPYWG